MGIIKLPSYKSILAAVDFLTILGTFYLSAYIVYLADSVGYNIVFKDPYKFILTFSLLSFAFLFIFQANNLYKINIILSKSTHLVALVKSIFYSVILTIIISFFIKFDFILDSRRFIFSFTVLLLPMITFTRIILSRGILKRLNQSSKIRRNILIVGSGKRGKFLATKLILEDDLGINVVGFVDDEEVKDAEVISGKRILGKIENLSSLVKLHKIDEIIISLTKSKYERILEVVDYCKELNVSVKLNSQLFNIVTQKFETEKYSDIPVVEASPRLNNYIFSIIKRTIDILGALLGIILLSPIILIIILLVKTTSKGPIFHTQFRIGKNGKKFKFLKFRTMVVEDEGEEEREAKMIEFIKNGSTNNNGNAKIINENRITGIGKILRKTSLDELPQLLNVLIGDMSLVGPRPCLPYEYKNFYDWQKRKVNVLPGCTGVWQVSGRSSVSFNDSIILDLYYINNMSPWLDLQIILKTIPVMLFAKGGK